jgi:hypothetical protein
MCRLPRTTGFGLALLCALPLGVAAPAAAQTGPPIHGVTGTMATDATTRAEGEAGHAVAEGVGRVVDGAKKILPGSKGAPQNPLEGLIEGDRVVLRDASTGEGEARTTEAVVVDINRKRQQITVRLADRKTETLRLPAANASADVVVSYTDKTGKKIARDFKRVS